MKTGLDPEILTIGAGYLVPASYFLDPTTKDSEGALNSLSYDNAAIEIRPKESKNLEVLADRTGILLNMAVAQVRLARQQNKIPPKSVITLIPAARLHKVARDVESVKEFGCAPSQTVTNDYGVSTTIPGCTPEETPIRSAGFHIHQELSFPDTEQPIVAILDGLLGLADVVVNQRAGWSEASRMRRGVLGYGRAGEYRTRKVKGKVILEYRVLSPWPLSKPSDLLWVTSLVKQVCEQPFTVLMSVLDAFPSRPRIVSAINHADCDIAHALMNLCSTAWAVQGGSKVASSRNSVHTIDHPNFSSIRNVHNIGSRLNWRGFRDAPT